MGGPTVTTLAFTTATIDATMRPSSRTLALLLRQGATSRRIGKTSTIRSLHAHRPATAMPSLRTVVEPPSRRSLLQERFLSTQQQAPALEEEDIDQQPRKSAERKERTSKKLKSKDPLIVTPGAEERILELLSKKQDAVGIRLGVKRRGCNGLSYTLNYVEGEPQKGDLHMTTATRDIDVWIEPMALFHVVGTVMDWEETELTSEFTFQNPNSKGECGCGESFTV